MQVIFSERNLEKESIFESNCNTTLISKQQVKKNGYFRKYLFTSDVYSFNFGYICDDNNAQSARNDIDKKGERKDSLLHPTFQAFSSQSFLSLFFLFNYHVEYHYLLLLITKRDFPVIYLTILSLCVMKRQGNTSLVVKHNYIM